LEKEKRVLILAGGGGHTGFAYALAQRLEDKASMTFLIPEGDNLSYERLIGFGKVDYLLKPRGAKTPTDKFTYNLARALANSMKKVKGDFDAVVSTGSNFCIPPALVAFLKGIPIVNIEGEARFIGASKTARILQPLSTITALQWTEQKNFLKGTVVGPIFAKPEIEPWNGGYVLVTGGTLGHKRLFDVLNESDLKNVVLQTGEVNPEPYRKRHPEWKVIDFSLNFHELIAGAEVVVTHQGSTPLEAVVYRKPSVIVPNPELKRTFPRRDSEIFAKKVGATFLSDFTLESLVDAIEEAKNNKIPLLKDGAKVLAEMILNL
jgi:UDP-N-acetylglucosamine--N-acetylmuramyl-(pentapeptide) pyrophosphoryl-undecaprenol N-acetylglucosamine transferase